MEETAVWSNLRESTPVEPELDGVNDYRIIRQIGRGGMGEVYLAEQQAPVRRLVAIKLLRIGVDSPETRARFEAERQSLASMSHPGTACIYDAGTTASGRPYLVMEYVKGEPITQHCDEHYLSIRERLYLFVRTCDAIQHAHQKAIIHRDIKPANVLVTLEDERRLVKVIDFGIAKTLTAALDTGCRYTAPGRLLGTPEYMSPEQAQLRGNDVDTRTDIYSLGLVLYELLTGTVPFARTDSSSIDDLRARICDLPAERPSARLARLNASNADRRADSTEGAPKNADGSNHDAEINLAEVARRRRAGAAGLVREIRGDLDWIVMRAIDKDRARRYASASEFADDVRRHLEHRAIKARPPSIARGIRLFARRQPFATFWAIAFILLLTATLIVTRTQLEKERYWRRQAEESDCKLRDALAEQERRAASAEQAVAQQGAAKMLELARSLRQRKSTQDYQSALENAVELAKQAGTIGWIQLEQSLRLLADHQLRENRLNDGVNSFEQLARMLAAEHKLCWDILYYDWRGRVIADPAVWDALRAEPPARAQRITRIEFDWKANAPFEGMPADNFAAVATTTIPPREVECALTLIIDDAVRVWLDGVCLLDEWSWHPARVELSLPIAPSDQPSSLVVEYFEVGEPACMIVRYFNGARPFEPEPIPESQSLRYAELLDSLANLYEQIDACDKAESARSRAQAIRNGFDDQ